MSTWRAAWRIASYEIRTGWTGLVITFIFFAYVALVGFPLLEGVLTGEMPESVFWVTDVMYLSVLPNMGFILHPSLMRYWRDDPYTKKLAYWKTLPISNKQIAAGRYLQMLLTMVPVWLFFFLLQYVLLAWSPMTLSAAEFANYALSWLGYSMLAGTVYVYLEQTLPGKTYFVACLCYIPLLIGIVLLLRAAGVSPIVESVRAAEAGNWVPAVLMLAAGAAAAAAGKAAVQRMIARRNILG